MSPTTCRMCGSQGTFATHRAREMQFGTREAFDYVECETCGSVQIATVPSPADLARHYPEAYYSFAFTGGPLHQWLWLQRDKRSAGRRNPIGALAASRWPDTTLPLLFRAGIERHDRVVDVGCGSGTLLDRMARLGFAALLGVDPFITDDLRTPAGVPVRKVTMSELDGEFDVVMFNHSLEHVPDPTADLVAAADRLRPGGLCVVRLPTTDSVGWTQHKTNWSSLDPPRHIVLPSRRGMTAMAERAGLEHVETVDDSHADQYLVSELYSRDISSVDPAAASTFGPADRKKFAAVAERANREGRGDQAMFVLRKPRARKPRAQVAAR